LLSEDTRVEKIHLVATETGQRIFAEELNIASGDLKQLPARLLGKSSGKIEALPNKDVGASIASAVTKWTRCSSSLFDGLPLGHR